MNIKNDEKTAWNMRKAGAAVGLCLTACLGLGAFVCLAAAAIIGQGNGLWDRVNHGLDSAVGLGRPMSDLGLYIPSTATVSLSSRDFSGEDVRRVSQTHRGLNFNLFGGSDVQWDSSSPGNTGFKDVSTNTTILALLADLGIGHARIPGGTDSNYYDHGEGKSWNNWALGNDTDQFVMDIADWQDFWTFHGAIGEPGLIFTANVYSSGSPDLNGAGPTWIDASEAGEWVADVRDNQGITGAFWEGGNEVYSTGTQTPGMTYPGSYGDSDAYVQRFCDVSASVKGQDAEAQVGLVLYEFGVGNDTEGTNTKTERVLDEVDGGCGLDSVDHFIIHDYAPLVPRLESGDSEPEYYQAGVEKALVFQNQTSTVADFKTWLSANHPDQVEKPVYVTEYGMLQHTFADAPNWDSAWYDKGAALLLMHHHLDLIAQGADGLWFWEAFHKMFRLIDPDSETPTALYHVMQRLFELRGTLVELHVSGSRTFDVEGPVGSGCVEGESCDYWHTALAEGDSIEDVESLKVFGLLRTTPSRQISIVAMNFAAAPQALDLTLRGLFAMSAPSSVTQWQVSAAGWDEDLSDPSTSTLSRRTTSAPRSKSIDLGTLPARSATVFTLSYKSTRSP